MKNALFLIGGAIVSITLVFILPKFILGLLGCYQIGSWVGTISGKLSEK